MLFKEEIYMWFKHSEPHRRVEFVCGILNMCLPLELKFIRTFVENLGKRDDILKDSETKCNKLNELKQLGKVLDERTRSKLILYLALLEANNHTCSKLLYDCLLNYLGNSKNNEYLENTTPIDKDCYNKQMQLIFTMMVHHPAFKYEEVKLASKKLALLSHYEEKETDCWNCGHNSTKMSDHQSPHHLNNLPIERSQVMEACDSGLSIGTEPEGEILSDHSCVPNQCDQPFSVSMCTIVPSDKIEENKRKDNLWQIPCPMPPDPVLNASLVCKTNGAVMEPAELIAQELNAPIQGTINSSSGESLNIAEESAVSTTYIYNSSIYERAPIEVPPSCSVATKRETPNNQRHQTCNAPKNSGGDRTLWMGSVSNIPISSTYLSTLQSSQVATMTSIVTTSPQTSCHESSLSSGVMSSVVVSRTTMRPAPLPRQSSSSSSNNSHPSSPAMINGPRSNRYPVPTNHRLANDKSNCQQNYITQSVNKDELSSIISGPLSDTISFMPSIEDCNSTSNSEQSGVLTVETNDRGNFKLLANSSTKSTETAFTTTVTTTLAISTSQATAGKNFEGSKTSIVSSNSMGHGNHYRNYNNNDIEKKPRLVNKMSPRGSTMLSNCSYGNTATAPGTGPVVPSSSAPFITPSGSSRMPAYTFFPTNTVQMAKPNTSVYYASKTNAARINAKGPSGRRRNLRGDLIDAKQTQIENSTSSSQYSSPSQTPSPDIKKPDKSESNVGGEISEVYSGFPIHGSNSFTDNNSPPPVYNQYSAPPSHQRHRYMSFPQQSLGFIPYHHHPPGMFRYPIHSPHLMMGSRPPPPPSGGDKSSREATPPSVNMTAESSVKVEVSPTPLSSSSVYLNRKSSSASPPGHAQDVPVSIPPPANHIGGHGPVPYNGHNYQMFPGPFFTPVPGFMPGHTSLGNGFVPQIAPNFSLPPMTEIMYHSPYSIMGTTPQGGSAPPPYQAVLSSNQPHCKPKRSQTCYNCGQVGHMGSDCNESSMIELTKCT